MHIALMLIAGIALLAVFVLTNKGNPERAFNRFLPVWLGISVANMIVGTVYEGYSLAQEALASSVIFFVPLALAFVARRFAKG